MSVFGTPNNNTGSVFTFGNVTNTKFSQSNAANGPAGDNVPNPRQTAQTYPSGSLDVYGDYVIFGGRQKTINGLANAEAANIGSKAADVRAAPQKARKVGIESIDRLTGVITYVAGSWETYNYTDETGVADSDDNVANSIENAYELPANFTYLNGVTPETTTYSTAR